MFRECWFLLLCILQLQYELTTCADPTFAPFTLQPTSPTGFPTHRPTALPSKSPTLSPTIALQSNEDIKIVAEVTLSGEAINDLCTSDMLNNYELSLVNIFIAASGVNDNDVKKAELTNCNILDNGDVTLTYNMRSDNSRSRNIVIQRINSGEFLNTYQENLNLVFTDVLAKSADIIEGDAATKEKSTDDPFEDFFSASFGLGVVIFVVSVVWCFLLRADEGDVDQVRLKQLREEKRKFEEKYGVIEEDSVEAAEREIPKAVELVGTSNPKTEAKVETANKETKTQVQTQPQTNSQPQPQVQAQVQVQAQAQAQVQTQDQTEKETTYESKAPESKPAETAYRASVVDEVKHVAKDERGSVDLEQIKDPGNKRRKTQEYLNNLWDDKNEAKGPQEDKDAEDGSEESEED